MITDEALYPTGTMEALHQHIRQLAQERLGRRRCLKSGTLDIGPYRAFLKAVTLRLRTEHRTGHAGIAIVHARSYMMDQIIEHLFADLSALHAEAIPADAKLAVVAFGGYGRHELNPQSDVDVMILTEKGFKKVGAEPWLEEFCSSFHTALLDLKLKLGYVTRNIEDCIHFAKQDVKTMTSLIEIRLLAGNGPMLLRLRETILKKCVEGHENKFLSARLVDQQVRRKRYGNTPFMQEPEIKNGCGGLRDYQNLIWMAFFKYRVLTLDDLLKAGHINRAEHRHLSDAYDFLQKVRNEMHYRKNRAEDKLYKSIQPQIAYGLGFKETSPSKRIEAFMQMVYFHMRQIFLLTRQLEESLALDPTPARVPFWRHFLPAKVQDEIKPVDGFLFDEAWIKASSWRVFRDQPRRMIRIFLHAQQRGLKVHPGTAQMMRHGLHILKKSFQSDEHAISTFMEILGERGNVGNILRMMHEVGVLGKFLPEFGRLTGMVQHEFFHMYTTDEHTLQCLEHLDRVWEEEGDFHRGYSNLFQDLDHPHLLYLALLLHDAGKSNKKKNRSHSDIGLDLALRVGQRLGLPQAHQKLLAFAVEHHLTMAEISQRRDLESDEEIQAFARLVGNVETLDMLTLLTFCDSMGTSRDLWTGFKDSLLWTLYDRTRQWLNGQTEPRVALEQAKREFSLSLRQRVRQSIPDDEIQAHLNHMPDRYFRNRLLEHMVEDVHLTHRFMWRQISKQDRALEPIVHWRHDRDRGFSMVDLVTWDRPAIFCKFTGALAAAGLNILSARIFSRSDGIVLDSFEVVDAGSGELVRKFKRDKFSTIIKKVLGEAADLDALVEKQIQTPPLYQMIEPEPFADRVRFDNQRLPSRTVLEVETEDRVGLLYRISKVLNRLELDLSYAKILTEKGAAVDTFYLKNAQGSKITEAAEQETIRKALLQELKPKSTQSPRA